MEDFTHVSLVIYTFRDGAPDQYRVYFPDIVACLSDLWRYDGGQRPHEKTSR